MKPIFWTPRCCLLVISLATGLTGGLGGAAEEASPAASKNWSAAQDHKNMMAELGIVRLRPGPSGPPGATNSANYDQAKANPFPNWPDPLTLKSGQKVTTAEM